jgi:hypothetical protein
MRLFKLAAIVMCVIGLSLCVSAGQKQFGVADSQRVTFVNAMRVGDVLLPSGEYRVLHTMQGNDHIMVFTQLDKKNPVEARIKCQLVPRDKKADRTETTFVLNAANERVLKSLVFAGDTAVHVF